jgi:magnesium chelatase accessory protein
VADEGAASVASPDPPEWWPHRERSRFTTIGALRWHAQHWPGPDGAQDAPRALLLHGTGASTHSWRHLAPRLAERFEVVAPDLPGHAFTLTPRSQALSLDAVAAALAEWLAVTGQRPALVVGHSAGAAIALRLALAGAIDPALIVSINGAILPLQGPVGRLFLPLARLLSGHPWVAPAFAAWASGPGAVRRLLDGTGSRIDEAGARGYAHLVARREHAAGALRLMASWDLAPLEAQLPALRPPLLLIAAAGDRTLAPSHAHRVRVRLPAARVVEIPQLGHLAHEEDAAGIAAIIGEAWTGAEAEAEAEAARAAREVAAAG